MDNLIIRKDGIYGQRWNPDTKTQDEKKLTDDIEICHCLRTSVEIDDGVTYGDIVRTVAENEMLGIFISCYNRSRLDDLHEFMLNEPLPEKKEDDDESIEYIEVCWYGEICTHKKHGNISLYASAHGIGVVGSGSGEVDKGARADGREHYAYGLTPANELRNLPVKLNHEVSIHFLGKPDTPGIKIEDKKIARINTTRYFSLLEVLDALYEELTFYGGEEDKVAMKDGIAETMDEFDAQREEGKSLPWKEGDKEKGEYDIYLSDQARDFMGLPSNEDDRDEQIRRSADEL